MGCAGGSGVNFYRLYLASQSPETRPAFDFVYFTQFLGLMVLGGLIAWANDASQTISLITAFYIGLSVPAVIKVGSESIRKPSKPRKIG